MEQKNNDHYADLSKFAQEFHEKNKKRKKVSGLVLILLPVILGFIRWFTDSDKITFLLIWVLCMFALSIYLVSVEYLDQTIRKRFEPDAAEDAEEGDDQ